MTIDSFSCSFCKCPMSGASPGRVCESPACRTAWRRHLEFGGRTCLVCGVPLSGVTPGNVATCGCTQCQMQYLRQTGIPADRRCRVCRIPLPQYRVAASVCTERECIAINAGRRLGEKIQAERDRIGRLREKGAAARNEAATRSGIEDSDRYSVAVVPFMADPLVPNEPSRVAQMRARLESIVEWAFTHESDPAEMHQRPGWDSAGDSPASVYQPDDIAGEANEVESTLFSTGCRMCRGYCCKTGGVHAYLNIGLIRKFMAANPGLGQGEVISAYLQYVPELSVENSCVFHGERGCSLPREMRSDMCNRWLCPGLTNIRNTIRDGTPPLFYIVAADEGSSSDEVIAAEFAGRPNGELPN